MAEAIPAENSVGQSEIPFRADRVVTQGNLAGRAARESSRFELGWIRSGNMIGELPPLGARGLLYEARGPSEGHSVWSSALQNPPLATPVGRSRTPPEEESNRKSIGTGAGRRNATKLKLATLGWSALAAGGLIPVVVGLSMGSQNSVGGRLAVIFVGAAMISLAGLALALGKRIHRTPP
jgi:hypothetical protein